MPVKCLRHIKKHRAKIKGGSNAVKIVCVMKTNWLTVESPRRKPDCLGLSNSHDGRRNIMNRR